MNKPITMTLALFLWTSQAAAQTEQVGARWKEAASDKLRFEYVEYRPARYETEHLTEPENERPNRGGRIHVYLTNVSDENMDLRFYRCNGKDESHWRLGDFLAWDRIEDKNLSPGETTVLEMAAVSEDFSPGRPFSMTYVDRTWRPHGWIETTLKEDPVQVSLIRCLPGLQELEVHVRHSGQGMVRMKGVQVCGVDVESVRWVDDVVNGPGNTIARVRLNAPLPSASRFIVKVEVEDDGGDRAVYSHRRAFEDFFPIGTWSADPQTYALLRSMHIDTVVNGETVDGDFYQKDAARYGFRSMYPTEKFYRLDALRGAADHPAVVCWMLYDEPDWSTKPSDMLVYDSLTRSYNQTRPTFITLCRNVKFFEYAFIADIPCHDHYCVTAPSSSKWPHRYGTRVEETGYYTRDLKFASEPKPIWVWSQAIADWDQRPLRPVPTPDEIASQLLLNLGRGAKGILWFNYDHEVAEQYPDARGAMRDWGRVLALTRRDFQQSEPYEAQVEAPATVDVATLTGWESSLVVLTNLDYEIHEEAYPWRPIEDFSVSLNLPEWLHESPVVAEVSPQGIHQTEATFERGRIDIPVNQLEVGKVFLVGTDPAMVGRLQLEYKKLVERETELASQAP